MATLYKNDERVRENSVSMLLIEFADPFTENDLFVMARDQFLSEGEFEWVQDNDVYLIKKG